MERRLPTLIVVLFFASTLSAQTPSIIEHIRFPLWAELDAYPGLTNVQKQTTGIFDYPVERIKQTAPFLIAGMVYGWDFTYTPSDKMRSVAEYFSFSLCQEQGKELEQISYSDPWIENNTLNCWVEFTRTPQMIQSYYLWASINHPSIHGKGFGKIENGFDGITDATKEALKDAVRTYFRSHIKNKPKEITGKVLIRGQPEIGIDSGRYIVQLDFFLETVRIIPYTLY